MQLTQRPVTFRPRERIPMVCYHDRRLRQRVVACTWAHVVYTVCVAMRVVDLHTSSYYNRSCGNVHQRVTVMTNHLVGVNIWSLGTERRERRCAMIVIVGRENNTRSTAKHQPNNSYLSPYIVSMFPHGNQATALNIHVKIRCFLYSNAVNMHLTIDNI